MKALPHKESENTSCLRQVFTILGKLFRFSLSFCFFIWKRKEKKKMERSSVQVPHFYLYQEARHEEAPASLETPSWWTKVQLRALLRTPDRAHISGIWFLQYHSTYFLHYHRVVLFCYCFPPWQQFVSARSSCAGVHAMPLERCALEAPDRLQWVGVLPPHFILDAGQRCRSSTAEYWTVQKWRQRQCIRL